MFQHLDIQLVSLLFPIIKYCFRTNHRQMLFMNVLICPKLSPNQLTLQWSVKSYSLYQQSLLGRDGGGFRIIYNTDYQLWMSCGVRKTTDISTGQQVYAESLSVSLAVSVQKSKQTNMSHYKLHVATMLHGDIRKLWASAVQCRDRFIPSRTRLTKEQVTGIDRMVADMKCSGFRYMEFIKGLLWRC